MSEGGLLSDAETFNRLQMLAENAEYAEVMDYRLEVQTHELGGAREWNETVIPLADAVVNVLHAEDDSGSQGDDFARVIEVVADGATLFLEADHRGPEHGWDGWVGDGEPSAVVKDIELLGVDDD